MRKCNKCGALESEIKFRAKENICLKCAAKRQNEYYHSHKDVYKKAQRKNYQSRQLY